jgi:hypothetical protein
MFHQDLGPSHCVVGCSKEESYGFPYHFQIGKTDVERLALPIRNVLLRDEVVTKLGTHARE